MIMNKEDLIKKYEGLEGVWDANGAEIARQCFLRDLEQLNEIDTKKVTVPQYVADWIEEGKKHCKDVSDLFDFDFMNEEVGNWFLQEKPFDLVARAWLDGYEVEEEKRYLVKVKGVDSCFECLYYGMGSNTWSFRMKNESGYFRRNHTRKELEDAGFGEVFNSSLFEVEEVEE